MQPRRTSRVVVGAISGTFSGLGVILVLQQVGALAMEPASVLIAVALGAVIGGLWVLLRGRRGRLAVVFGLVLMGAASTASERADPSVELKAVGAECLDVAHIAAQPPPAECKPASEKLLDETSFWSPFRSKQWTVIEVSDQVLDASGGTWGLWIELFGVRVDLVDENRYSADTRTLATYVNRDGRIFTREDDALEPVDAPFDWWTDLASLTGVYHIGISIEGASTSTMLDGYVHIGGLSWLPILGGVTLAGGGFLGVWRAGSTMTSRRRRITRGSEPADAILVSSPGSKHAEVRQPDRGESLADTTGWAQPLVDAFIEHHIEIQLMIAMGRTRRSDRDPEPLTIEVPTPEEGHGQFVLTTDPDGVVTWCPPTVGSTGRTNRYTIPSSAGDDSGHRDRPRLLGELGSTLMSVVVFPLLDPVFGAVGERFAAAWERTKRPYGLRSFTPENFDRPEADEPDWDEIASGRSLLMVHGTFSRAHTGFAGLSKRLVGTLEDRYEGRIFAFDHPTLSEDPRGNIEQLFSRLPDGIHLDVDIVCHSRGGLVSRVLAEKQDDIDTAGKTVRVHKVVFAAAPNGGTILADPEHVGDMLDSYTNLMNFVATPVLADAVITVAKHVAVGVMGGLDGLRAMQPGGDFLAWLNSSATNDSQYFSLSGDFEPTTRGWKRYAANRLMDGIFDEANDLVVPTAGVYAENGSSHFPISERVDFGAEDGVHHSGYFNHPTARRRLVSWLES